MIAVKVGQLFALGCLYAGGYYIFGIDIVYFEPNLAFQFHEHRDSGIFVQDYAILIRINENWVGIAQTDEGMLDVPLATWAFFFAWLGGLWSLLFDWGSNNQLI